MFRVTFISCVLIIWAADIRESNIERKINITLTYKNVSDSALLLDRKTFVSYNGLRTRDANDARDPGDVREADSSKPDLRVRAKYKMPPDTAIRKHILDLMRHHVYTTQERMLALEPILKKYENDPALRMAFIYNRLRQLIIDLRRLYTVSSVYVKSYNHPVYKHMFWYSHMVRKYFDVIYIVEHVIELFGNYVEAMGQSPFYS